MSSSLTSLRAQCLASTGCLGNEATSTAISAAQGTMPGVPKMVTLGMISKSLSSIDTDLAPSPGPSTGAMPERPIFFDAINEEVAFPMSDSTKQNVVAYQHRLEMAHANGKNTLHDPPHDSPRAYLCDANGKKYSKFGDPEAIQYKNRLQHRAPDRVPHSLHPRHSINITSFTCYQYTNIKVTQLWPLPPTNRSHTSRWRVVPMMAGPKKMKPRPHAVVVPYSSHS